MKMPQILALRISIIANLILSTVNEPNPTAPPTYLNYQYSRASLDPNTSYVAAGAATLETEVELSIAARNLQGRDVLSKSDPMCVTYIRLFANKSWTEYHRTEMIRDNHNPKFTRKVLLPYSFEEQQQLLFKLYDVDSNRPNLDDHDFLGEAECNLGEIMHVGRKKLTLKTKNFLGQEIAARGEIIISSEKLIGNFDEVIMKLEGTKLDNKDWFGKSDPYLEIYKRTEGNDEYILTYKTEVIRNTLEPRWRTITVPIKSLCNGDYNRTLKFICWDWDRHGKRDLIGEFHTNLDEIANRNKRTFDLKHPKKMKSKRRYKNSGQIKVVNYTLKEIPSFADYLRGGLQIHCTIAIDFTISNGNPKHYNTLHYRDPTGAKNKYEEAIASVVSIIEDYDSDKKFPVYGFGASFRDNFVRHCFNVNLTQSPDCEGVQGVLEAYRKCLYAVDLSGPTNFEPVIRKLVRTVSTYEGQDNYFILLILTDGDICDMEQTEKVIVEASALPISIIIVGIGNAEFRLMEQLDGDHVPLTAAGVPARRDIVQFVPFKKFNSHTDNNASLYLAREVLAEVPGQVVSYMQAHGYQPKPAIFAHSASMASSYAPDSPQYPPQDYQEQTTPAQTQPAPLYPIIHPSGIPHPSYAPSASFQPPVHSVASSSFAMPYPYSPMPAYSTDPFPNQPQQTSHVDDSAPYFDPSNLPPHLDPRMNVPQSNAAAFPPRDIT